MRSILHHFSAECCILGLIGTVGVLYDVLGLKIRCGGSAGIIESWHLAEGEDYVARLSAAVHSQLHSGSRCHSPSPGAWDDAGFLPEIVKPAARLTIEFLDHITLLQASRGTWTVGHKIADQDSFFARTVKGRIADTKPSRAAEFAEGELEKDEHVRDASTFWEVQKPNN